MSKEIKLVDLALSEDISKEDKGKWTDCVIRAIESINTAGDCVYLLQIDADTMWAFNHAAQNLGSIFRAKGVDNIVFVPKNKITLSKIEVVHS